MIHEPLTKLQCSPTSDGAAAAIVASERYVDEHDFADQAVDDRHAVGVLVERRAHVGDHRLAGDLDLRGTAEARQVDGARVALQHNIGLGGAAVVSVYRPAERVPA